MKARKPEDIRILVGCEKSGVGRRAFARLGFDALYLFIKILD
jgi:hypothetical protein